MRATSLIIALAMQSVITVAHAQDAAKPLTRPIPKEYKDFVAEVASAFRKYPEAASHYELTSIGPLRFKPEPRKCVEVCKVNWQEFFETCRWECEREQ